MKLSHDEILYMNAFASVSGVNAKDCLISEGTISFLVKGSDVGRAIGKNASNVKILSSKMKKHVEILEYCEDIEGFLKKAFYNVELKKTETSDGEGKKIVIASVDAENKSKILSNTKRLKRLKEVAKRNYGIDDIRIK